LSGVSPPKQPKTVASDLALRLPRPQRPAHRRQGAADQICQVLAADRKRDLDPLRNLLPEGLDQLHLMVDIGLSDLRYRSVRRGNIMGLYESAFYDS